MENILLQRFKNLTFPTRVAVTGLVFILTVLTVLYFSYFNFSTSTEEDIYDTVMASIQRVEERLGNKIDDFLKRSEEIGLLYLSKKLQHADMHDKEALILEQNGIVKNYWGEIYHFRYLPLATRQWTFIEKRENLYFVRKMADHLYYESYFCNLQENMALDVMNDEFGVMEVRYSSLPIENFPNLHQYDKVKDMFFYNHRLRNTNGQLLMFLKFSGDDIRVNIANKKVVFFLISLLIILLFFLVWVYFNDRSGPVLSALWLTILVDLFFLLPELLRPISENTLFMTFDSIGITFNSLYQLLILVVFLVSVLYLSKRFFKYKLFTFILFNLMMALVLSFSDSLFNALNFDYQGFSLNNLALLLLLLFIHLIPLIFIRSIAQIVQEEFGTPQEIMAAVGAYILLQGFVILLLNILFNVNMVNALILSLISCILLFFKRNVLSRALVIFLLALSVYQQTAVHAIQEKQEFISQNLKQIFLNQSNYAKFIAREIIHQINSDIPKLHELFQSGNSMKLEDIWQKTLASQESIASGIFVLDEEEQIVNSFAFQIPFLQIKNNTRFPFWAVEDTTAEIHGKEIPLAAASIRVAFNGELLGRIIVQVLNSPELLLRYQENVNIFTIDKKIDGRDLSYIKLNSENQILENPSNLNLENISGILKGNNQWVTFESLDTTLKGYIFKDGGNTIIIFFPGDSIIKELSQVIKVFVFFSLIYLFFIIKDLKHFQWRTIYYSYSIRVFSFLLFISLLTAIVFSILFINFSYRNSEEKVMRIMYENGRLAQNIGYNLIKKQGDFTDTHLFSISDILNGDVTVYSRDGLVETSNFRKILNSQIPMFVHSRTVNLLDEKNQRFVLVEGKRGFRLFFKIYDYIFMVEYSNKWEETLSDGQYYADFIITLFFLLIIVGFSAAVFFRNKILSPIEGLNHGMAEVREGNLPILQNIPAEIEIKSLYTGFNNMIEGIREQKKNISEISRMKTIIRLGRHVAHEVKNPLTPIQLSAEQILRALMDKNPNYEEIIRQSVNYIIDETEHLRKVSYGFLDLSKLDEITTEEFDLLELIRDEMFSIRQVYTHLKCSLHMDGKMLQLDDKTSMRVTLDKIKIKQVLKNLINNSVEAIGEKKGEVQIEILRKKQRFNIIVKDSGTGMNEDELEKVFEKEYSTKEIGTGLGLFIVKRIIELHRGIITIESEKNKGTSVILDLPIKVR